MFSACKNCSQGVTADCFAKNCISADGIEKGVLSVNRQIPGPAVQVSACAMCIQWPLACIDCSLNNFIISIAQCAVGVQKRYCHC